MSDKDDTIAKQKEQIDSLKKATRALEIRLSRIEQRNRSADANIRRNAMDIRNVAIKIENLIAKLRGG